MDAIPQNFRVPTSKESDLMAMVTPKTKPKTIQVSPERETLHSVNNNHNYNINKNDGFAISRVKSPSDLVLLIRRKKFNEAEQLLLNSSGLIMAQRADVFGDLPLVRNSYSFLYQHSDFFRKYHTLTQSITFHITL